MPTQKKQNEQSIVDLIGTEVSFSQEGQHIVSGTLISFTDEGFPIVRNETGIFIVQVG